MKKEKRNIKQYYAQIREMHEKGMSGIEIGAAIGIDKNSVYNAIHSMGLSKKRDVIDESTLVYAEYRKPVIEHVEVNGKSYSNIIELLSPR